MRIYELENQDDQDIPVRRLKKNVNPRFKGAPKTYTMGSGAATSVFQKQNKPHEVMKITRHLTTLRGSMLINFLQMCIKNEGNPFLPAIYSIKVLQKPDGSYLVYVETEVLKTFDDLNWKQISYLYNTLLGDNMQHVYSLYTDVPEGEGKWYNKYEAINTLVHIISARLDYDETRLRNPHSETGKYFQDKGIKIQSSLALKAIRQIASVMNTVPGTINDLSINNIMFRTTPYGVQLVITDPLHKWSDIGK